MLEISVLFIPDKSITDDILLEEWRDGTEVWKLNGGKYVDFFIFFCNELRRKFLKVEWPTPTIPKLGDFLDGLAR